MTSEGSGFAEVAGIRLWFKVVGRGPICLVPSPGWGMSIDLYAETLGWLGDAFTLVFIDSRGSGRSGRPASTADYGYARHSADLEGVRRHLGAGKVWVLGHSMAGVQAMRFALDYPGSVAGLLLIGTYAEADEAYAAEVERRKALRAAEPWYRTVDWGGIETDVQLKEALSTALPLYFHKAEAMPGYRRLFETSTYSGHAYRGWLECDSGTVSMLDAVGSIQCPTLLVVGEGDFVCPPSCSRRIRERVPRAELAEIAESGHFPWIEQPASFERHVRVFLSRQAVSG